MVSAIYRSQVQLLVHCLPAVVEVPYFALKGGTAINLFYRDMPRVSVDIDLAYLPVNERDIALSEIRAGLATIGEHIRQMVSLANVRPHKDNLFVSLGKSTDQTGGQPYRAWKLVGSSRKQALRDSSRELRAICSGEATGDRRIVWE